VSVTTCRLTASAPIEAVRRAITLTATCPRPRRL